MKIPTAERAEMAATGETTATAKRVETTVGVKLTSHVRSAAGTHRTELTFEGETLRAFLGAFFTAHDVRDLVIVEREADATTRGWARVDRPPGTWRRNPEGEQTQPYTRVLVNGMLNENLDSFDMWLEDGGRVALMKPFLHCT